MQASVNQTIPVHLLESLKVSEMEDEERAFLRGVVQGLMDLEEGRERNLAEVKKQLGLG